MIFEQVLDIIMQDRALNFEKYKTNFGAKIVLDEKNGNGQPITMINNKTTLQALVVIKCLQ